MTPQVVLDAVKEVIQDAARQLLDKEDAYLSARSAANYLDMSYWTFRKICAAIPCGRAGKSRRWKKSDLDRYVTVDKMVAQEQQKLKLQKLIKEMANGRMD